MFCNKVNGGISSTEIMRRICIYEYDPTCLAESNLPTGHKANSTADKDFTIVTSKSFLFVTSGNV